jgi:NAD(P)-dependent dehydrogenase (short-subunit alcohol dehydrogenase family)
MGNIAGKVAIVTGAGRGIGRGIAVAFGKAGGKVVVASRSKSTVDSVAAEIKDAGGAALGVTCDVSHRDQIFAMVDQTVKHFGGVDILVNNAQSFGLPSAPRLNTDRQPVESYNEEEFEYVFRSGMLASWWAMKAVFPHMKDKGGKVINFGSMSGQIGTAGTVAYNCTKEAIRALTRTAAREWGKYKINVNVVNPSVETQGLVDLRNRLPDYINEALARVPLGRFGDPEQDAGALALFLASSDSDFITGQTFMLDGGLYLAP